MASPPRRRKRYNTLSPSFEKEYRFVKDIVLSIKHRTSKYLGSNSVFTENECHECAKFIQDTCDKLKLVSVGILTYNEFVELIENNHRQRILCIQTDAYHVLNKIQKWQDEFRLDATQSRDRLLLCLHDHVYVLSDSDHRGDHLGEANLDGVSDFNKKVQAFRTDINSKMDALKDLLEQQERTSTPYLNRVHEFASYVDGAREVGILLHSICDTTLEWMREEGRYPDVLWQQMTSNNVIRENHAKRLLELRQKRSQLIGTMEKKTKVREQMEKTFALQNKERRKMKNSRQMLELVISNLEDKVNWHQKDVSNSPPEKSPRREDPERIKDRPPNSKHNCSDGDYHIRQLQVMQTQYTRIKKEQRTLYISNYELKMFISNKNHQLQELQRQLGEVDVLINNESNELTKVTLQTDTLRKMRDDRLSPGVFKKSTAQQNNVKKNKSNVEEACRFVAKHIGRHWKRLYDNLPFNPPRTASRRTSDVEMWDKMCLSQDRTDEDLARRCLAKWRVLNRRPPSSVAHLIVALRKTSQQDLATKVKYKFLSFSDGTNMDKIHL